MRRFLPGWMTYRYRLRRFRKLIGGEGEGEGVCAEPRSCREALAGSAHNVKGHGTRGPRHQEWTWRFSGWTTFSSLSKILRLPGVLRRAGHGVGRRDPGRGAVGWPGGWARRRPCRHRHDADPGRPRPGRADEVPPAAGGQTRVGERTSNALGIRRLMLTAQ